jgi:DUF4097 and DUF4098 domain-containing protein YvlB
MLSCLIVMPLQAGGQNLVKRGSPERHGRAWLQRSEITAPVREGGRLVVRVDSGSVTIQPGASERLECEVTLRAYTRDEVAARRVFSNYELSVKPLENGGAYITGHGGSGGNHGGSLSAEYEVKLPRRFNLDVQTQGGDLGIEDALQGEAKLTTAGGDIQTGNVVGPLKVETAGGSISLGNVGSRVEARTAGGSMRVGDVKGDANLETSGGEIEVGQIGGALRAETAGGDVVIGGARGQVVAQTAGGQIEVGPASGGVRAETAGGSIRLQGPRGRVVAETAGGSIDLLQVEGAVKASTAAGRILSQWMGGKNGFGASQLETSMGDVFVYLPVDVTLTVDAAIDAAAGHKIVSDFPIDIQGNKEEFCRTTIHGRGSLNGGGEVLRIRTVAGNIEIRKLDAKGKEELKSREETTWQHWEQRRTEKERARRGRENQRRQEKTEEDKEGRDEN